MTVKEVAIEWEKVEAFIKQRFGEPLDEQTVLFVIGLQELGKNAKEFKKEEKLDIIHIGICTVLMPYGYYKLIGKDDEGWPHFKNIKKIPNEMQGDSQKNFVREAIIKYLNL